MAVSTSVLFVVVVTGVLVAVAVLRDLPDRWYAAVSRWAAVRRLRGRVEPFLASRGTGGTFAVLAAWFVILVLVCWLVGWGLSAAGQRGPVAGDHLLLDWLIVHRRPWLTPVMSVLTGLGASLTLVPVAVAASAAWWRRRRTWRGPIVLLGGYAGNVALYNVVKLAVARDRPAASLALAEPTGHAFPSGHAANAAAIAVAIVIATASAGAGRRAIALASGIGTGFVVLVAATRLYLAAHWLTDVVVGALVGAAWVAGLAWLVGWGPNAPPEHVADVP